MTPLSLRRSSILPVFWLLLLTLVSVSIQGLTFPSGNNLFHLPILLDYAGSAEGPHDAFSQSSENFVSYFWVGLAQVVTEENIEPVIVASHVLLRFLTLLSLYVLLLSLGQPRQTNRLVAAGFVGIVGLAPLFLNVSPLGRNDQLQHALSHSVAVIPVVLLALVFVMRGRPIWAAVVIGLAFNVNAFVAIWFILCLGLVVLFDARTTQHQHIMKTLGLCALAFLICGAPTGLWILSTLTKARSDGPPFNFLDFIRLYFPGHTFPDVMVPELAAFAFAALCFGGALRTITAQLHPQAARRALLFLAGLLGVLIIGVALPYLTAERLLINLFPLRMDTFVYLIAAALLIAAVARNPDKPNAEETHSLTWIFGAAVAAAAFLNGNALLLLVALWPVAPSLQMRLWTLAMLVLGLVLQVTLTEHLPLLATRGDKEMLSVLAQVVLVLIWAYQSERGARLGPVLAAVALLPGFALPPVMTAPLYGCAALLILTSQPVLRMGVLCLFVAAGLVAALIHQQMPPTPVLAALLPALIIGAAHWLPRLSLRLFQYPGFVTALLISIVAGLIWTGLNSARSYVILRPHPYAELGAWLRANTPPHSTLLPVNMNLLSAASRRPVWVDWKTGAVVMWKPSLYSLWHERYLAWRDIQTVSDAARLATDNDIDFVVFRSRDYPTQTHPAWNVVHETRDFWVAQIRR